MKENMYAYINPGVIHFMAYPSTIKGEGPILETLEKIAVDDFFGAIELTWIKDQASREEAKKLLEASHLDVYYGAQPRLLTTGLDLNSFNPEERKKAVATIKEGVDEAIELGAKAIAFLSGKNVEGERKAEAIDLLVDSLKQICAYARSRKNDLGVVLEIFDYDVDKCSLVGPVEVAREVAERVTVEYDNFGLMVDLSHLPLLRESAEESIIPIKDYLVHIHIGNGVMEREHPAYGDSHPRFGLAGGANDVDELVEFLRVLIDIGYLDGKEAKTVSFEVKPLAGESSEVILANAKRTLRKAWAKL